MNRLYSYLAEIAETADGGFNMTRRGRRYFGHFLRQHGKTLRGITTHAGLIEALRHCNALDFARARQRMLASAPQPAAGAPGVATNECLHRQVA